MKFALPILFIITAIAIFVGFTNPVYLDVQGLSAQAESYNEALANSKKLQAKRDELTQTYNNFSQTDVQALETMIPDSVDNIGLIQEIQRLGLQLGITVKNVNFDPNQIEPEDGEFEEGVADPDSASASTQSTTRNRQTVTTASNGLYDTFLLEFTISGSYANFVAFLQELEKNLRIVDISDINFTASSLDQQGNFSDVYDYTFTTRTYRLITE